MEMSRSSDPLDPLLGCSLFPSLNFPSHSSNPLDLDHHLLVINRHLKSTTASLSGLKDHAKNILSGGSGVKRSDLLQVKGLNGVVPGNVVENQREKRQGLGLKRPRFSLKPNFSLGSKFDSKSLKNPEEYFTVFERNQNADREVREMEKKMGGAVLDADEQNPLLTTRARRPGLPRGPVKFRHRISSHHNETEDAISTEEMFETSLLKHSSQTESHETVELEEMDLAGSKVKEENKQNSEFLNELLSQPTEELEGDGAVRLLKERFNIKTYDGDICLQQFPDTQKADMKSLRTNLLNPRCVKPRQGAKGSIHLSYPRPPKSPLSSWSDLMKRSLVSSPSNDPYSASDIDQVPVTNPSSDENRNKQSDRIDISEQNMSDKLKSSLIQQSDKIEGTKTGSCEVAIKEITNASERSKGDSLSKPGDGYDVDMEEEIGGSKVTSETSSMLEDDTYTRANGIDNSDKVEDKLQEAGPEVNAANSKFNSAHSQVADDVIHSDEMQEEDKVQEVMPEHNVADSTLEKLNGAPSQVADTVINYNVVQEQDKLQDAVAGAENGFDAADSSVENLNDAPSQLDQLHSTAVEERPREGLSRNPDVGLEKQNEIMQEQSRVSSNKRIEANSRSLGKQKKKKEVSKRQSLAAHGTSWKYGVRRSTRMRTRPLEYWKGERLLIGRVHDSLPTVIGMKYASPGKGEGLKVKSFVSKKHKGLVDLVSYH